MPQVAAPARFAAALPGTHGLPPIVQPLGHEVSPLATPGLVVARTHPIEMASAGSIPAPVQRRAARGSKATPAVTGPGIEPGGDEHAVADTHEAPDTIATANSVTAPIRSMPTVSRSAVRVPDRPLTSAATAARPAAVQRAAATAAPSATGVAPSSSLPQPSSGGMRRAPSSASRTDSAASAVPAAVPSGRSGLGEPMTALPASARPIASPAPVVARSTTAGPMPVAASGLRPPVQRSAGAAAPTTVRTTSPRDHGPASPAVSTPASGGQARLPELPHLPVARLATAVARSAPAAPGPVAAAPPTAAPEVRPIAGANPIRTSVALQREAADDLDDAPDDDALPSPWWASPEVPMRRAAGPAAAADGFAASIQRSVAGVSHASPTSTFAPTSRPGVSGAVSAPAHAPVQRVADPTRRPSLPALTLPHPAGRGPADAGATTFGAPSPTFSPPTRSVVSDPVVQTSPARPLTPVPGAPAGPTVQREGGNVSLAAATPAPQPAGSGSQISPAGPAGAGGQPAQPSGHSERDLDELAQALFGRIRGRLRSDLIYDREAKGLTFDNV